MSNSRGLSHLQVSHLGLYLYAFGSFTAGVFDLIWGNFDAAHQPLQAWGDNIPGATVFAYITGVWMVAAALALPWPRSRRAGGAALSAIYFIFALFWLPRFYTAPHYLGVRLPTYIGVFGGVGIELIAFAAGVLIWASMARTQEFDSSRSGSVLAMRWVFGICTIAFGLQHLTNISANLQYVPTWLPPGAKFWVIVTGVCFVLAGLAILTRIQDTLAAWMLGLMFLVFNLTILPTYIFADPKDHAAWGGNAYNLAAVGSAWILAETFTSRRSRDRTTFLKGGTRTQKSVTVP
jgi:uncharacterized membrane protein